MQKRGKKRTADDEEKPNPITIEGMSSNTLHEDVPIVPHKQAAKAAPDYLTVTLPYAKHQWVTQTNGSGENNIPPDHCPRWRLNSCVDPEFTGAPSIAPNTSHQVPQGFNTWSSIYQYYYVKECHVKITVVNNSKSDDIRANRRIVGLQWFDEGAGEVADTRDGKLQSKRSISKLLMGANEPNGANVCELQFSYTPETFQEHITELKETNTVWTKVGDAPKLKRTLHFDACDMSGSGGNIDLDLVVEMSYVVQFREPNTDIIKGPFNTSPWTPPTTNPPQ